MSKQNSILNAPPIPVKARLTRLGANLRTARLARNLSLGEVAAKLGVGRRTVAAAEAGKTGTAAGVYFGLMWIYGQLSQADELMDPARDDAVLRAALQREHAYPTGQGALDDDF